MLTKLPFVLLLFLICVSNNLYAQPIKEVFLEGMKALEQSQYDLAINRFEAAIKIKSDFAPIYNFLGLAYKGKGRDVFEVMTYFEKAIELDPQYAVAYENLGKAYFSLGNNDKALKYCLKASYLDSDLMTTQLTLGWLYLLGKSEPKNAIKHFRKVVENTNMPYANLGLGIAYFQDGQKPMVLDMITSLRRMGEEKYAKHLEAMIQQGRYIPPIVEGMRLELPQRKDSVLVIDEKNANSGRDEFVDYKNRQSAIEDVKDMPVRLKAKLPDSNQDVQESIDPESNLTGSQRLEALQRKGQSQSPFNY